MKKIFKFFLIITLVILISSISFSRNFAKADLSNTYFEDFIAMSHEKMLFVEENNVSKCYLIEGVTPSYMIYDYDHNELLYYCEECEKMIYENHKLAYESVNENYHRRYCIVCSYSEIVPHQSYGNEFHYITLADGTTIQYCPQCGYEEE